MPVSKKSQSNPKKAPPLTLGAYIHSLRTSVGMSLRALQVKTGISLSSLCRIERGESVPSIQGNIDAIDRLWQALGGDMSRMLYLSRRCPRCDGTGTLKKWKE